jgi:hypothetical protein
MVESYLTSSSALLTYVVSKSTQSALSGLAGDFHAIR